MRKTIPFSTIAISFAVACLLFFSGGLMDTAAAAICKDSTGANVNGFTVQIIYCVRATITDALSGTNNSGILQVQNGGFLGQFITLMAPYKWAAITLAMVLFGMKLMTMDVEDLMKEGFTLIFKIAVIVFLINALNSTAFYNSATGAGLYGALADAAGELVSFVAGGFNAFTCTPPALPAGVNPGEYKVWQEFDCMFNNMFSFVANPAVVTIGILGFIGAAIFTGGLGVAIVLMAITLFIMILLTLARAIYTLLLSYFILAMLILIGPLVIPAMIFDNRFTKEVFLKWVGMITSVVIQPLFVVGFLSFFLLIEDQFVDGTLPTCNVSSTPNQMCYTTANDYAPCAQGMGVCSVKQILQKCQALNCLQPVPIWTPTFNIRFNANCNNDFGFNIVCDGEQAVTTLVNWGVELAEKIGDLMANMVKIPKLVNIPMLAIFTSFLTFLIVTFVLRDLMEVIPHMAREMTMSVGVGVYQLAQLPLQSAIGNSITGAGSLMKDAASKGGNPLQNIKNLPQRAASIAAGGLKGAASQVVRSIIK